MDSPNINHNYQSTGSNFLPAMDVAQPNYHSLDHGDVKRTATTGLFYSVRCICLSAWQYAGHDDDGPEWGWESLLNDDDDELQQQHHQEEHQEVKDEIVDESSCASWRSDEEEDQQKVELVVVEDPSIPLMTTTTQQQQQHSSMASHSCSRTSTASSSWRMMMMMMTSQQSGVHYYHPRSHWETGYQDWFDLVHAEEKEEEEPQQLCRTKSRQCPVVLVNTTTKEGDLASIDSRKRSKCRRLVVPPRNPSAVVAPRKHPPPVKSTNIIQDHNQDHHQDHEHQQQLSSLSLILPSVSAVLVVSPPSSELISNKAIKILESSSSSSPSSPTSVFTRHHHQ